ncbi:hypothetical protein D3C75_369190 [compost metagenome]
MVFGADDAHIHFLLFIQLVQQNFRSRTGSDNHRFAFQVCEIFNLAAFFGQQTGTDHENSVGEGSLFLTLKVVGGGAALKIEGTVLQQRNTVLRGDWDQLHFQIRFVQLFLHRVDDGIGVGLRVAHDFLRVVIV